MISDGSKLTKFLTEQPGLFRTDCNDFPWHSTDRSVWYALLAVENGEIDRCAFSSSAASKKALCDTLRSLAVEDEMLLLGVWTGRYSTNLFVIDRALALEHLEGEKRFERFEHLRNATDVVKTYGPRGGFRNISYSYLSEQGTPSSTSTSDRSEMVDLEAFFEEIGIPIAEDRSSP